ncbi:NAD-dependent epimerase/dehydratase family protein [Herbidospora sp. RD11066]
MSTLLVTGAAGKVGSLLRPLLARPGRTLRLLDLAELTPGDGEEAIRGDLTDPAVMRTALAGADAVVHLGGLSRERDWASTVAINMTGTQILLETARDLGVKQVVLAGSHHAAGFLPRPEEGELPDGLPPRPDTFYGVSKVVMEALGSLYHDRFGLNVVVIRIGSCAPRPPDVRGLGTWLSPGDCARLVEAALTATGFHVVWGVSDNTRRWWSLEAARAIGYEPLDDAEDYATEPPEATTDVSELVGGPFTTRELGGAW